MLAVGIAVYCRSKFDTSWLEIVAFVTGAVGTYLATREQIVNYPIQFVSAGCYFWILYDFKLYADAFLMIFYSGFLAYGWYWWLRGGKNKSELPVSRISRRNALIVLAAALVAIGIWTPILRHYGDPAPLLDATLAIGTLAAQFMLDRKWIECWILYLLVDLGFVALYFSRAYYPSSILYGYFCFLAIAGILSWSKSLRNSKLESR